MRHIRFALALLIVALLLAACESSKQSSSPEWKTTGGSMQAQSPAPVPAPMTKSLYERLGGEPAIIAVIDDFVPRAANDPKVNFARKGVPGFTEWQATPENVERVKTQLVQFIGSATGGPQKYTGKELKAGHAGMKITNAEFDAIAEDLKATLDKLRVPAQEQGELMAIVGTTRGDIVEVK